MPLIARPSRAEFEAVLAVAAEMAEELDGSCGMVGYGVIELTDTLTGLVRLRQPFANLITTAGDQYYTRKAIVGIAPAAPSAPTAVTGMKLGTGTTAVAKSGAGAALVTYKTGSNVAFNTGFPVAAAVSGTDTGWTATYKCTWPAGTATQTGLSEAVIVTDSTTDATSTAANSISRTTFTPFDKASGDALDLTWAHKMLGS